MHCKDCKYWREPNNKMGLCVKTITGWRDGVGTMSEDGWEAGIYTGPDFGCVHFEDDSLTNFKREIDMQYLTDADIEGLHHTSQGSFYYEHKDLFEIVKGSEQDAAKDGEGTMMWYATQLEGLIAFNYYATKYKAVLLWDMAENPEPQHCVIIDKKFEV